MYLWKIRKCRGWSREWQDPLEQNLMEFYREWQRSRSRNSLGENEW